MLRKVFCKVGNFLTNCACLQEVRVTGSLRSIYSIRRDALKEAPWEFIKKLLWRKVVAKAIFFRISYRLI